MAGKNNPISLKTSDLSKLDTIKTVFKFRLEPIQHSKWRPSTFHKITFVPTELDSIKNLQKLMCSLSMFVKSTIFTITK